MFLKKRDTNDVATLLEDKDDIELVCVDGYKRRCYLLLAGLIMNYVEQVFITGIKANMECFICHVLLKKKELVTRLWKPWTYQSTWTHFA